MAVITRTANFLPKASAKCGMLAFLSWALIFPGLGKGASIVVPNSLANAEAGNNNSFPFSIGSSGLNSQRYQQIYDASQFAAAPGGGYITQILFRPDGGSVQGFAFSATVPSVQIQLSTTSAGADGLNATFNNNIGPNAVSVYFGALPLSSDCAGPAGGPKNFDIVINLRTPFFYNPANGNLLMDVWNYNGGSTTYFDCVRTAGDAVSRLYTVIPDGVNLASGQTDSAGLVTKFTIVPPALSLNPLGTNAVLSWSTNAIGWHLQSASGPTGEWSDFSASMSVQGANVLVVVPPTNSSQWFRLRYP